MISKNRVMKKIKSIAVTAIGSSHLKMGKPCQDCSLAFSAWSHTLIIVCDGHGGAKHFRSKVGAEFAARISKAKVKVFAKSISKVKEQVDYLNCLKNLAKSILSDWRRMVAVDLDRSPFTDKEMIELTYSEQVEAKNDPILAYGSTMLLAAVCKNHLFILQLGDGDCCILTKKGIEYPISQDDRLQFSRTTSLCDGKAIENVRMAVLPFEQVKACFLSSDGVKNSFSAQEYYEKFLTTVFDLYRKNGRRIALRMLSKFLPNLSKNGSSDDVSLAVLA